MRYFFLFLFLFFARSVFPYCDMLTVPLPSGGFQYIITCDPEDTGGGGGGGAGGGTTNITISCTNCTSMTPEFCADLKSNLENLAQSIYFGSSSILNEISYTFNFVYSALGDLYNLQNSLESDSSISEYYYLNIEPTLSNAKSSLSQAHEAAEVSLQVAEQVQSDSSELNTYVSSINCAACQSSQDVELPSGGGSSSTSSPPVSVGCPCSELLHQIKSILNDMNTELSSIRVRIDSWDSLIKSIQSNLTLIQKDVNSIRQVVVRMDDFFRDDTDYNFQKLIEHTLSLSNTLATVNVSFPPNLYWQDYTNATKFLNEDGSSISWSEKGKLISQPSGDSLIDFGEYSTLNWFQRIEYLLGNIAGIFSETNSIDSDFSGDQKHEQELVSSQLSRDTFSLDDHVSPVRSLLSKFESLRDKLNPFHGVFNNSSVSTITLLPNVSLGGRTDFNSLITGQEVQGIQIDLEATGNGSFSLGSLIDLSHSLTTFLWFVFLLLLNFTSFLLFFRSLIKIYTWYHAICMSWAHSLVVGGSS